MPNITTTTWATLIPMIWARGIISQLRTFSVVARLVDRNAELEAADAGDRVRINKIGALTVGDKLAGTPVTRQAPLSTSQDLILDKHKISAFLIEDRAKVVAMGNSALPAQVNEAARAIAEQIETDVLAAIEAAAAGANIIGTFGTNADETLVLTSRKTFVDNKAPQEAARWNVWHPKDVNSLLTTSASKFTKANERGDEGEALRSADLGELYRSRHFESQAIKVVTGTPDQTSCVAFTAGAVVMAMRPMASIPEMGGAVSAIAVDELSGLAVRVTTGYAMDDVGLAVNVDALYGIKVVRPEWVQLVRT